MGKPWNRKAADGFIEMSVCLSLLLCLPLSLSSLCLSVPGLHANSRGQLEVSWDTQTNMALMSTLEVNWDTRDKKAWTSTLEVSWDTGENEAWMATLEVSWHARENKAWVSTLQVSWDTQK